jgi:hypothetical protein
MLNPKLRRWRCNGFGVLALAMLLLSVTSVFIPRTNAQPATTNLALRIQGDASLYSTETLDLCKAVHLGSCPGSLSVDESFAQDVSVTLSTPSEVLSAGQMVGAMITPNPSSPSASLEFVFNYDGRSYSLPYQLSGFPTIGSSTLAAIPIPVGALTTALGLPPLPITLTFSSTVISNLAGTLDGNGFTNTQALSWTSASSERGTLDFIGGVDTASLNLDSFMSVQDWGIGLSAGATGLYSIPLLNTTTATVDFKSNDPTAYTWYEVSMEQANGGSVTPASGNAWYLAGYQLQVQATPDSNHNFENWLLNGQFASGSDSYVYQVQAPATIEAQFSPISISNTSETNTPVAQPPGISQGDLLVAAGVIGAAVIIAAAIMWRRH